MTEIEDLIQYLSRYVTESRLEGINTVLSNRTKHLTVVLEDIYQSHNASAVIRSCDCFGIQDLHIIENTNQYTLNPGVTQGSSKWVDMHFYNDSKSSNTLQCLKKLKSDGYKIVATTPHSNSHTPDDIPIDSKVALVFGTELTGISDEVRNEADEFLTIPIFGFTESYNISVSVALCLYRIVSRLQASEINWTLAQNELWEIKKRWLLSVVKNGDLHVKNFYRDQNSRNKSS